MGNVFRRILLLGIVAATVSGCVFMSPKQGKASDNGDETAEGQDLQALTPEEQEIMTDTFGEDERSRFEEGRLFSYQEDALSQLREGVSYLKNRYPGHDFHCISLDPANIFRPWAELYFKDGDSEEFLVKVIAQKEDGKFTGTYKCEDLFYSQLLGKEYDAALEKLFSDAGYEVRVHASFIYTMGEEFPAGASANDLLKARPSPQIAFYVSGAAEDEVLADSLKSVMEENNIDGNCWVYFMGRDVTDEDIRELEDDKADVPYVVFHTWKE